jgi:hypothetical protein
LTTPTRSPTLARMPAPTGFANAAARLGPLVLRASAAVFAGIGTAFLVAPERLAGAVGLQITGATADGDVRAVYGGLQLACGGLLWTASLRAAWVRAGLVCQAALFSGLALGRFVSWAAVGVPGVLGLALHAAELVGLAAGLAALVAARAGPHGQEADSP